MTTEEEKPRKGRTAASEKEKPRKGRTAASEDRSQGEYRRQIDKSLVLEEGLREFPILYIEAAAAAGKTTALNLLLDKYPDQRRVWLDMARECKSPEALQKKLEDLTCQVREESLWIICDPMPARLGEELVPAMTELLEEAAESNRKAETDSRRVLFLGREKPEGWLLPFLWKEKLGMVSHQDLLLTREEVGQMAGYYGRLREADAVWDLTGGWAGCVSMVLRLAARPELAEAPISYLWQTYEMEEYIRREIKESLTEEEKEVLELARICPWVNEALCQDLLTRAWDKKSDQTSGTDAQSDTDTQSDVDTQSDADVHPGTDTQLDVDTHLDSGTDPSADTNSDTFRGLLEDLTRKGFLQCNFVRRRWKPAPLFRQRAEEGRNGRGGKSGRGGKGDKGSRDGRGGKDDKGSRGDKGGEESRGEERSREGERPWDKDRGIDRRTPGKWYQARGYVREALECLSRAGDGEGYRRCMLQYYKRIPFLGMDYSSVLSWQEDKPEIHYLKGMWLRSLQDFKGLDREIALVQSQVESQRESQVGSPVESQVESRVGSRVGSRVESQVGSQAGGRVESQIESQAESQVRSQVASQVQEQPVKPKAGETEGAEGTGGTEKFPASDSGQRRREILLNLTFAAPGVSLEEWLSLAKRLSEWSKKDQPYELYSMMGSSFTFLCGLRDLTGLFACGKREEKRRAQIWRTCLGQKEELAYRLARMDYLLETEQIHALTEEDRGLLQEIEREDSAFALMRFYLTCKARQRNIWRDEKEAAGLLEGRLLGCDNPIYRENARALAGMYAPYFGETAKLAEWIRSLEAHQQVTETNYGRILLVCGGFLKYQRPENIRKLLEDLTDHLQAFHYQRLLAEALFLRAILAQEEGSGGRSTMLKAVIQAFLVGGSGHYIRFYTSYGSKGQEVLEAYREWSRNTSPERWKRKKRYHYASPAQMPEEDYLDLLIRQANRHRQRENRAAAEEIPERLTAMETVVLQAMSRGLSNGEICEELSLKLPTVKSHIYSIYKKLGVSSRVQAILRGKERRIL